jgi:protein SCO1/2
VKVGIEEKLGGFVPLNLKFYNSDGDTVALIDIIKKPTIISLVYYNCAGVCNPLMNALTDALNHIQLNPVTDFNVITISFDHTEKSVDAKKWKNNYLNQMTRKYPDKGWYFMTGDSVEIKTLTNSLGFYFKEDGYKNFIHTGSLFAISPNGMISRYLYFDKYFNPFDIKMALIEAGEGKTNPTISKVLQYCFSYDPEGKKYVFNFTKVIGTFMLLSVAVLFVVLVIKGRKRHEVKNMEDIND